MEEKHNEFQIEHFSNSSQQEAQWISLSDLMTGLMMIFLLVAVTVMADSQNNSATKVAASYQTTRVNLYDALNKEFSQDLPLWGAELDKNLTIRFKNPDILFDAGKDELKPKFEEILKVFFPRYMKVMKEYKASITEIRIEGHTSKEWNGLYGTEEAYFENMKLSQSRTRSTLRFVLGLSEVQSDLDWLKSNMTANGLSSSKLIEVDGKEDVQKSRRVEFRIRTDAEEMMGMISGITTK